MEGPLFSARLPVGAEPRQCVRLLLLPRAAVVAYVFAAVFGTAAVLLCWAGMPKIALIYLLIVLVMLGIHLRNRERGVKEMRVEPEKVLHFYPDYFTLETPALNTMSRTPYSVVDSVWVCGDTVGIQMRKRDLFLMNRNTATGVAPEELVARLHQLAPQAKLCVAGKPNAWSVWIAPTVTVAGIVLLMLLAWWMGSSPSVSRPL